MHMHERSRGGRARFQHDVGSAIAIAHHLSGTGNRCGEGKGDGGAIRENDTEVSAAEGRFLNCRIHQIESIAIGKAQIFPAKVVGESRMISPLLSEKPTV